MKINVEYTDTFGGEVNCSWVERYTIDLPDNASDLSIVRAAKKAAGLSGVGGKMYSFGDSWAFYPYRSCTVLFITIEN